MAYSSSKEEQLRRDALKQTTGSKAYTAAMKAYNDYRATGGKGAVKAIVAKASDKPKAPAAPKPQVTSTGPAGSSTVVKNPDGSYSETTTLDAADQKLKDQGDTAKAAAGDALGKAEPDLLNQYTAPMDYSSVPDVPGQQGLDAYRDQIYQSLMDKYGRDTEDQISKQNQDFEQQMANRGISVGSSQYNTAKAALDKSNDQARLDAQNAALTNSGNEMTQQFGVGLQAHNTSLADVFTKKNVPYQQIANLMGLQGNGAYQSPTDVSSLYLGQAQLDAAAKQNAVTNSQNQQQIDIAKANAGRGGGGSSGYTSLTDDQKADMTWQYNLTHPAVATPSTPSPYASLAGQLLGSAAPAIGTALGTSLLG